MNITINEQEGRLVAALEGDLDNTASMKAEKSLAPVFECTESDIRRLRKGGNSEIFE